MLMLKTIDQERVDLGAAAMEVFAARTGRGGQAGLVQAEAQDALCDLLTALHTYADTAPGLTWEKAFDRSASYYAGRARLRLP